MTPLTDFFSFFFPPKHTSHTLRSKDPLFLSPPETVYNTYLTLSSTASPLASASASSRSIFSLPRFRKKRRTKQNRMATAAIAELVANAVWSTLIQVRRSAGVQKRGDKKGKLRKGTYGVSRSVGLRIEVWRPDLGNVTWFL